MTFSSGVKTGIKMEFIDLSGKRVFRASVRGYRPAELDLILEAAGKLIRNEPPGSVLCLTEVNDLTPVITNKHKFADYLKMNKPYIKASAIFGVPSLLVSILNAIDHFAGRGDIMIFKYEEEAVKWLTSI